MSDNRTRLKLTKSAIERLPSPTSGYTLYRDNELPGFGVRVTAKGVKTFFLERRVPGERNPKRMKVGRYGDLTAEQARKHAQSLAGDIAKGNNPVAKKKKIEAEKITLADAMEAYLLI